jgi:SAM-dependent methyltransferase
MFDLEHNLILRKVNKTNEFYLDESVKRALTSNGVMDYEIILLKGEKYIAVKPFFFPNDVAVWSAEMFKNYCHMYYRLSKCLKDLGLYLIDGHPWNVVFYFSQPKFVDLGSITKRKSSGWREFNKYKILYYIFKYSEATRGRRALESQMGLPPLYLICADFLFRNINSYKNMIKKLLGRRTWLEYYASDSGEYRDIPKENVLLYVIESFKPKLVYDIGCNTGHYSLLCESQGCSVVACDPDRFCIDYLYQIVKKRRLNILPILADIAMFSRTIKRHYEALRPKRVDLVLILALIHHLVYKNGYNFDDIFRIVDSFGTKMLLIEFVNKDDVNVSKWDSRHPKEFYNINELIKCGRQYFKKHEIFSSHDRTRRIVLFGN